MSHDVRCETCKKPGRVRDYWTCPEDWYWTELVDDSSKEEFILIACSEDCARLTWHKGATKRTDVAFDTRSAEFISRERNTTSLVQISEGDVFCVDHMWYRIGAKGEGFVQIDSPFEG